VAGLVAELTAGSGDMQKILLGLLVVAFASALPVGAQQALPSQFGNWTKSACLDKVEIAALSQEAGGKESAFACAYASGANKIQVWMQRFHDPSAAYEVYTAGLKPGMMASLVGNNAAVSENRLWMLSGKLVLRVDSQDVATEGDLRALVKSLDGSAWPTGICRTGTRVEFGAEVSGGCGSDAGGIRERERRAGSFAADTLSDAAAC